MVDVITLYDAPGACACALSKKGLSRAPEADCDRRRELTSVDSVN
jgi:hypothetical protein